MRRALVRRPGAPLAAGIVTRLERRPVDLEAAPEVGGDRAAGRHSAELYASLGDEPVAVETGELQKLEGGVTCLSVLLYNGFS